MRYSAATLLVVVGAVGCGGTEPSESAVVLRAVSGAGQSGLSLDTLPQPLVVRAVRVSETGESAVPGLELAWTAVGAVVQPVSVTDAEGYAQARWRLAIGSGP